MRLQLVLAIASTVLAGCSLIYNPNNLPGPPGEAGIDAAPDAPPDAEIILDADPTKLELVEIAPLTIDEGQGDGGSRPALVVIGGHQIIDSNTTVEITADTGTAQLTLGAPVIARNGNWIAIAVTAHVDPALAAGQTRSLTVTVTQSLPGGGTAMAQLSNKLTLTGYDELDALGKLPLTSGKINSPMLAEKYSKVDLSAVAVPEFGGDGRAIVTSVSEIKMPNLNLAGANGSGEGEAGGCGGGAPASSSPCTTIGGAGGANNTLGGGGGGGGGFAGNGDQGGGAGGGGGGARTGDELIVTYAGFNGLTENRPGGGGGGGALLGGLAPGGRGGSSGGSLELTAGGDLSVGTITANGGNGTDGALGALGTAGGGGGAGGLVMLRAGSTLASGAINVAGGSGGGGVASGGNGSGGRVRWDAPTGSAPNVMAGNRTLHRGPSFVVSDPVFRITDPMIAVIGQAGDRFDVSVENHGMVAIGARVTIPAGNTAMFSPPLQQGLNRVCILLLGGRPMSSEAEKCVDVAFLP
jgi:hypothetical protein